MRPIGKSPTLLLTIAFARCFAKVREATSCIASKSSAASRTLNCRARRSRAKQGGWRGKDQEGEAIKNNYHSNMRIVEETQGSGYG